MSDTLSTYLRLRLSDALTAAARYNLLKIDDAFSRLVIALDSDTTLRSTSDILIEPESADIGGSGVGGTVNVGTPSHSLAAINLYGPVTVDDITVNGRVALLDDASAFYLSLSYDSSLSGLPDTANRVLAFDVQGANRRIVLGGNILAGGAIDTAGNLTTTGGNLNFALSGNTSLSLPTSGTVATLAGIETFTNKTMDGDLNTFVDIGISSLKTVPGDANEVIVRDGSGAVVSALLVDANVSSSAAIALTKLAALTANRALISNGSGVISASAVTSTELGFLSGVTSAVQTQIDGKAARSLNNLTVAGLAAGDLLYATSGSAVTRLPIGSAGRYLASSGAIPVWVTPSTGNSVMVKVNYVDLTATSLPVGTSYTPDGTAVVNGDIVLFTTLLSGDNRAYSVSGVGTSLVWTPVSLFGAGVPDPVAGDLVVATGGTALGGGVAIGHFDGSEWRFNSTVRYFEGTDYVEKSGIFTTALADGTTSDVFTVAPIGSENWVISFSVIRGALREVGTLHLVTDGSTAAVSNSGVFLSGATGVSFSADVSGGFLRLRYTTTSTGTAAVMKWTSERWSSAAGGPASVPNYAVTPGLVPAAGVPGNVQICGPTGYLDASADFSYVAADNAVDLDGRRLGKKFTATLIDATTGADAFTFSDAYEHLVVNYTLSRGTERQIGFLFLTHNGTTVFLSDENLVSSPIMGVTFDANLSGGLIHVTYDTTLTGQNASMQYSIDRWA